jgi:hypothetical protein
MLKDTPVVALNLVMYTGECKARNLVHTFEPLVGCTKQM